jgi:hypothetical protein
MSAYLYALNSRKLILCPLRHSFESSHSARGGYEPSASVEIAAPGEAPRGQLDRMVQPRSNAYVPAQSAPHNG